MLQLQGAEVFLGVQWLKLLGRIIMDYKQLYMEFCYNGKSILLQGHPLLQVEEVQSHQLRRLTQSESISQCFQLFTMSGSVYMGFHEQSIPEPLVTLLELYQDVFLETNSLPPHHIIDHSIHLLTHTKPVNVKPYRYSLSKGRDRTTC